MDSAATTSSRIKPFFIEGDYGPDSVAEMETGSSVNGRRQNHSIIPSAFYCNSPPRMRNLSMRVLSATNLSVLIKTSSCIGTPSTPFCSVECRRDQIEIDEAKEKKLNLSASVRALRTKQQTKSSSSNKPQPDSPFRTGTVFAA
ncbi:uncharacterized protein LOC111377753 [Olea europaea var. sylvestris]|uniref:uncharacterized protein LOC111377753 n=1 Tax=Olea europaea var. sylvestris TaxID=158386 RepID=UPI000C1D817F|nr:uncharacterized protein LOC111377753 [Olea europaea var. sylvestris]